MEDYMYPLSEHACITAIGLGKHSMKHIPLVIFHMHLIDVYVVR